MLKTRAPSAAWLSVAPGSIPATAGTSTGRQWTIRRPDHQALEEWRAAPRCRAGNADRRPAALSANAHGRKAAKRRKCGYRISVRLGAASRGIRQVTTRRREAEGRIRGIDWKGGLSSVRMRGVLRSSSSTTPDCGQASAVADWRIRKAGRSAALNLVRRTGTPGAPGPCTAAWATLR